MSEAKFKTMRHIETVRNFLGAFIIDLIHRQSQHDQTKLRSPEMEILEEYTPRLRSLTYASEEYKKCMKEMEVGVLHHYRNNSHHPEYYPDGIKGMNLLDLVEMLADWKAAGLRHHDGDLLKSIEINQAKYGFSDELKAILINTAKWLNARSVYHRAQES